MKDDFVILKDSLWLKRQKIAGRAVSAALTEFSKAVKSGGKLSLLDIEEIAIMQLRSFDCTPTFFNYHPEGVPNPFPGKVCLSVNNVLVHGIPDNYVLKKGDVVSLDLGATYEGAIADAAFTCIYGEPKNEETINMLKTCYMALNEAIKAIQPGKNLGVIGHTIFNYVKQANSKLNTNYGLITDFGGHGIDYNKPHAPPFVNNKSKLNDGIIIQPGLSIAIEPMLVLSKNTNFKIAKDTWSVLTKEVGCHFEHSVTLDEKGQTHIITEHLMDV